MADQKRWFKVWTSLLVDMDHLPNEVIGAWTRLGCRAALVGNDGAVTFASWAHLARFWNVSESEAQSLLTVLPHVGVHVCNEEGQSVNGAFTVTLENWQKYQVDSTVAERVTRLRRKRRGEKKREEENRIPPKSPRPDDLSITRNGGPETAGAILERWRERAGAPSA